MIVLVMLFHLLQSPVQQACKNVTLDLDAAMLLITPLLIKELLLAI